MVSKSPRSNRDKQSTKHAQKTDRSQARQTSMATAVQRSQSASTTSLTPGDVLALQQSAGNRAVQRLLANRTVQARLTVGPAGDKYEQEADRVANQVITMTTPPASSSIQREGQEESKVRTQPLAASISPVVQRDAPAPTDTGQGFEASSSVENRMAAHQSGGQPLPAHVRAEMEPKFGADFSTVQVHTGGESIQLNRELSAQAFTYGNHIHFSAGKYNPGSAAGKHLLAHELTHVIQQKSNSVRRKYIQRATATTMGGKWKTNKYDPVMVDGKPGGEIIIEFEPNDLVDSEKIGLLQKIEKVHNGKNLDAALAAQKTSGQPILGNANKTAAGRTTGRGHWDRALDKSNPVYGAADLKPGQGVEKTPTSNFDVSDTTAPDKRSNYQLGYNYKPFIGKRKKRSAMLHDKPNMPSASTGSAMIFETAAMSLSGKQKNVYYGSVKWGWRIQNATGPSGAPLVGDIELEPFDVISMGTPSAEMKGLADVWNQADTTTAKGTVRNTQVPTTGHNTTLSEAQLDDEDAVQDAIDDLEAALKGKGLAGNDKKNVEFELKFLKDKLKSLKATG